MTNYTWQRISMADHEEKDVRAVINENTTFQELVCVVLNYSWQFPILKS